MDYEDLTPEQMEKAKTCKTVEELVELAKSEGIELKDEQLEAVTGGESLWDDMTGCEEQVCIGHNCDNHCIDCYEF